jgi:signal transduction histidine kinase
MPFGMLVLASDLVASTSATEFAQWVLVWVFAGLVTAAILAVFQLTVLRSRVEEPISVRTSVAMGGLFGLCYGLSLWLGALLVGVSSVAPWPLRVLAVVIIGMWWIPLLTVAIDLVTTERQQRRRDIDDLVALEALRLREADVLRDMREEISGDVRDALDPVRRRVDAAVLEAEGGRAASDPGLPQALREVADSSVRPLSRELWRSAKAQYPRVPWGAVFWRTIRTQPLRTYLLAMLGFLGDGLFVIADRGWQVGAAYSIVAIGMVVVTCTTFNALMRRWPAQHARIFLIAIVSLQVLNIVIWQWREWAWGPQGPLWLLFVSLVLSMLAILITSGFGSWRSEMHEMRDAFRASVTAETIAALARGHRVADVTREVARELHGSVQTRLVACAMAMDKASNEGDRVGLAAALAEAQAVLAVPLRVPASATSVADEVHRKIGLWGELCEFRVDVDPSVESTVHADLIGRVVEEGLTNAIRHGSATEVAVHVALDDDHVLVEVSDNGVGPRGGAAGLGSAMLDQATARRWRLDRDGGRTQLRAWLPVTARDGA